MFTTLLFSSAGESLKDETRLLLLWVGSLMTLYTFLFTCIYIKIYVKKINSYDLQKIYHLKEIRSFSFRLILYSFHRRFMITLDGHNWILIYLFGFKFATLRVCPVKTLEVMLKHLWPCLFVLLTAQLQVTLGKTKRLFTLDFC